MEIVWSIFSNPVSKVVPFLATDIQWSCIQGSEVCAGLVLGLNSVKPGRKSGTYFPLRAKTKVMLAESRAGSNILHGTWKMPDILENGI